MDNGIENKKPLAVFINHKERKERREQGQATLATLSLPGTKAGGSRA
jgi:hypothetical protein